MFMDSFDIVPELLEQIKKDYEAGINDLKVREMFEQLLKSKNLEDAYEYARLVGDVLSGAFAKNITSSILPNERMYYNIANRIIPSTVQKAYADSAEIAELILGNINANSQIGIAVQKAAINYDRIKGIVERLSEAEKYSDVKFLTGKAVIENVTQSAVDDTIEANALFQYKSGLKAIVERKLGGRCCIWCSNLVGKYTYPNVPADVYRRHENCKCTVTYFSSKASRGKDVWTKRQSSSQILLENYSKRSIIIENNKLSKYIGKKIIATNNKSVREWYYANVHNIPNKIDKTQTLEKQAYQAFNLRNKYKHEARVAMSDKKTAELLEKKKPAPTFEKLLVDKMKRKGITKEEALKDILETASKTNSDVDKEFGL